MTGRLDNNGAWNVLAKTIWLQQLGYTHDETNPTTKKQQKRLNGYYGVLGSSGGTQLYGYYGLGGPALRLQLYGYYGSRGSSRFVG